jgi:uncharacterized membrane protein YkoI
METIKRTIGGALAAVVLAAGAGGLVSADHDNAKRLREAGEILPLATIAERARGVQPGRIIEIELEAKRGGYIYEVEIVDESGRVHELKLDARTGELFESEAKGEIQVEGDLLPLEALAERALGAQPGEIVAIELKSRAAGPVYKVEMLDESGRALKLEFDARSGEMLKREFKGDRG